jgi:hypothetical protein
MAEAEKIYPRSLYVRVRHAMALAEARRDEDAVSKFAGAVATDPRKARGWWYLLNCGRACASRVARENREAIAPAGELTPTPMIDVALLESELRQPRLNIPAHATIPYPSTR